MENQQPENYFDKFVEDLAKREELRRQHNENLQRAEAEWHQRRELDRKYREHTHQRIRYQR
jgi:hypothetical protein